MAGRERHLIHLRWIPCGYHHAAIARIFFYGVNEMRELIYSFSRIVRIMVFIRRSKVAPLEAVDGAEIALLKHPLF